VRLIILLLFYFIILFFSNFFYFYLLFNYFYFLSILKFLILLDFKNILLHFILWVINYKSIESFCFILTHQIDLFLFLS
jgi:hypothetical protein